MIYVGLGSNLGDRKKFLRRAFDELCGLSSHPLLRQVRFSSIYESEALLPEDAPKSWDQPYYNMVLGGETDLAPLEFLKKLKEIEKKLGRKSQDRWAPREIDLDILAWGSLEFNDAGLHIPHTGLLERPFALLPLSEIDPDWKFPVQGSSFGISATGLSSHWNSLPSSTRLLDDTVLSPVPVGILNVTPDSFSDGGLYLKPSSAVEHAIKLISEGARVIDIGADSTRPGSQRTDSEEEWKRIQPVLKDLIPELQKRRILSSVDTRNPETARRALEFGVDWINDVTGFDDQAMIDVVADSKADLVFMHSLGIPPSREKILPHDADPIDYLISWAEKKILSFEKKGIDRERLIFDPGVGFGKSVEQNLTILRRASRFLNLGVRVLVGHSRKSFLNRITTKNFSERDIETLTISLELARQQVHYVRVHQMEWHVRGFRTLSYLEHSR